MRLIVILIRVVLVFLALIMASILLIQPFEFQFITISVLGLGLIGSIWQTTFHLQQKTSTALYIPKIGMFLGSTIVIAGLLGLTNSFFDTVNPTSTQTSFGIFDSIKAVIGGTFMFLVAKKYTVGHTSNNDLK